MSIRPHHPHPFIAPDLVALDASPRPDPVTGWRRSASQACHPSVVREDVPLVEAIAGGLARVAVPWELRSAEDRPDVELVLATTRYDAWVVHWEPGSRLAWGPRHPAAGAVAIVSGRLDAEPDDESLGVPTDQRRLRLDAGSSRFMLASSPLAFVNRSDVVTTSVHVYSPPLVVPHPAPQVPPPTP